MFRAIGLAKWLSIERILGIMNLLIAGMLMFPDLYQNSIMGYFSDMEKINIYLLSTYQFTFGLYLIRVSDESTLIAFLFSVSATSIMLISSFFIHTGIIGSEYVTTRRLDVAELSLYFLYFAIISVTVLRKTLAGILKDMKNKQDS